MAKKTVDNAKEQTIDTTVSSISTEPEVKEQELVMENGSNAKDEKAELTKELTEQVNQLLKEKDELIEKVKYSQAELISYRMRKDEETANLLKYANQDLITELIVFIDNFEKAIALAGSSKNQEVAKYLTGFQIMYQNYISVLTKYGVEEINRVGQIFDPKLEQAMVADNQPDMPDDVVLEVLQKGYKLKDRVIRPASVRINQL